MKILTHLVALFVGALIGAVIFWELQPSPEPEELVAYKESLRQQTQRARFLEQYADCTSALWREMTSITINQTKLLRTTLSSDYPDFQLGNEVTLLTKVEEIVGRGVVSYLDNALRGEIDLAAFERDKVDVCLEFAKEHNLLSMERRASYELNLALARSRDEHFSENSPTEKQVHQGSPFIKPR